MSVKKLILIISIAAAFVVFYSLGLDQYLSLDYFLAQRDALLDYQANEPFKAAVIFFLIYVAVTALSLPAATLITLAAGAIFGLVQGLLLVSFASTIGASIAFLMARTLFRDSVQQRFQSSFSKINEGIDKEGAFYLFGLRLVPIFPFVAVNLLMGLTNFPLRRYFWVSQLGMLPGTFVYVNAGTQLAELDSLSGIASPAILLS
ncbi:TVP38/TMEM64 family protein, partial [Oleiphilus sp. HI0066]